MITTKDTLTESLFTSKACIGGTGSGGFGRYHFIRLRDKKKKQKRCQQLKEAPSKDAQDDNRRTSSGKEFISSSRARMQQMVRVGRGGR